MRLGVVVAALSGLFASAWANTEKVIFLGPATSNMPSAHPNLEDLKVDTLTPRDWTVRTHLDAEFPSSSSKYGKSTWLVLDQLVEGRRYEVRLCWAATQPTDFRLNVYELDKVFETPELMTSLSDYSWSRQDHASKKPSQKTRQQRYSDSKTPEKERQVSVLLLHIEAAADYYTTNQTLMANVPPVHVDIILDPFIFNVVPRTLVPALGYITVIGVAAWYLAHWVAGRLRQVAQEPSPAKKQQ